MNRYQSISTTTNSQGVKFYKNLKYPEVPPSVNDIYVISVDGDRFDILANEYYGDPSLWWVISIANPELPQNSLYLPLESQIRIPINPSQVVANYISLNQ
jgi:hypothetical protein